MIPQIQRGSVASKQVVFSFLNDTTLVSGGRAFLPPGSAIGSATESKVYSYLPFDCTIKNLRVLTSGAQDGSGTVTVTLRDNAGATALVATVTAGGAAGLYTDLTHAVAIAAGHAIDLDFKNNATATSAPVATITFEIDPS